MTEFIKELNNLISEKELTVMEAVILWAEIHNIEIEVVASWVKRDPVLRAKIQEEAEDLNFIKKKESLFT